MHFPVIEKEEEKTKSGTATYTMNVNYYSDYGNALGWLGPTSTFTGELCS